VRNISVVIYKLAFLKKKVAAFYIANKHFLSAGGPKNGVYKIEDYLL
jgi:hypothetical protein